jgi:hypothetical protein
MSSLPSSTDSRKGTRHRLRGALANREQHLRQRLVRTVPFAFTNLGRRPCAYEITVTVAEMSDPGKRGAHISSDGVLPSNATMSTKINFEGRDDIPVKDIDVRITDAEKWEIHDDPS